MEQGESKANVVKGNVLRLCVELTLRTLESVGANVESSEVAFVPKAGSVVARLADGARVVTMQVEGMEENRVTLADHGTLLPGEYSLEILCRDEQDNPYRYMKRCAVEVHDATACAGIEAGVEFDVQVQYLGATFTQVSGGSGGTVVQADWAQDDESQPDYIRNKPEIPVAPTKVSELENDAGYLTEHQDISGKVDKVAGKGLSTEDYTTEDKNKLAGLSNYDDTALHTAVAGKVDKEFGKGLSTNDFTTALRNKLMGIEAGAQANVKADWNAESGDAQILNKPTIPTKTSELTNDSGFLTQHQDISGKADKSDTYTKTQVDDKVANAGKVKSVSVNGGTPVEPDNNGNVDLTVAVASGQGLSPTVSGEKLIFPN